MRWKLIIEVLHADVILLSSYESDKFADFTYWNAHLFLYTEKSGKYLIESAGQVQRYTVAKGLFGGYDKWDYLDSMELNKVYCYKLQELKSVVRFFIIK